MVYRCLNFAHRYVFPPYCRLCGAPGHRGLDICKECDSSLPKADAGCRQCGMPLATGDDVICGRCLRQPPDYDAVYAAFAYDYPLDKLIKALKFDASLAAARLLGELMGRTLAKTGNRQADAIVPVPLHKTRLRERGYNQATELAKQVRKYIPASLRTDLIERSRHTQIQSELPAKARRGNVRGAFRLKKANVPPRVAVLDDVMTTGCTVNEIAKLLKRAGAEQVEIWVVARAFK
ncbi:hypothetical protein CAI21_00530 [Alkalilimnicola ehrlichii]|uniref:Uncharacterized protein n=2 Tax=Alkalilimnicola ehrlichii TaxID=351052 RepID=A0A3E0X537_9GAMM|nr:ComF family protein [Alkalilimnicola ehrlichii]RFA31176.1 hypothetical protein CAI21_00530 [Alkalilimnicola ehrlichii]RFA39646.1 hypothetical protein CAL65_01875 [Alkalilimnicola ehrlichii]